MKLLSGRCWASFLMLSGIAVSLFALASGAYFVGRSQAGSARFLDPLRAPTADEAALTYPVEYALRSTERNDVVFLGDSTCQHGIDPLLFEQLTGLRSYNLGSIGAAGPSTMLITAKAYLAHHPAPRAFVICLSPTVFMGVANKSNEGLPARFAESYSDATPSADFLIQCGSRAAFNAVLKTLFGRSRDMRERPLLDYRSDTYWTLEKRLSDSRGYWQLPGERTAKDYMLPGDRTPINRLHEWDDALRELGTLGIAILLRITPLQNEVVNTRDFVNFAKDLETFRFPGVTMRTSLIWYDRSLCWDPVHLNTDGTAKFMPLVAADVQAALAR